MTKNEIIPLSITSLSSDGNGVGRYNGIPIFVPFTAPGDEALVQVVKVQKNYAFGILKELRTPGPGRISSDCPVFGRCGGCALRHMQYDAELTQKGGFVQDAFDRIGGFSIKAQPCLPSPQVDRYRNKVQYPLGVDDNGRVFAGFFAPRSHRAIPCDDCKLQPVLLNRIASFFCALFTEYQLLVYREDTRKGLLRHLYLRHATRTGKVLVCIVASGATLPHEAEIIQRAVQQFSEIGSIVLNVNAQNTNVILGKKERVLFGSGRLQDTLCGVPVSLSTSSFYQVNTLGAEQLYGVAKDFAAPTPSDLLLDLYCGAGTIGLSMAQQAGQLMGVEIVPSAIESAKKAAQQMGLAGRTRFLCADAGTAAQQLAAEGLHPTLVVLDPPRKGCDDATLQAVLQMAPARIVMVSCNAATAARDAKILAANGYELQRLQPVDMFPRTKHVETVVLMSRVEGK